MVDVLTGCTGSSATGGGSATTTGSGGDVSRRERTRGFGVAGLGVATGRVGAAAATTFSAGGSASGGGVSARRCVTTFFGLVGFGFALRARRSGGFGAAATRSTRSSASGVAAGANARVGDWAPSAARNATASSSTSVAPTPASTRRARGRFHPPLTRSAACAVSSRSHSAGTSSSHCR